MKLLHVIAGAPVGGAETFAQDAILSLAERGVEQVVITRPYPQVLARYAQAGVRVVPRDFGLGDRLLGLTIARREAQALGADLVHAWMSRAAQSLPARLPCPVIGWFGDYYKLANFRRCDHFMAVTPDIVRYILAEGAPPHRAGLVNTFGDMPQAPPVDRASLDTPADAPAILVLSRMHAVKGIDTILNALVEVPDAYLWLAGDGPELGRYQALAQSLGVDGRVRFLGWRNDRKALLEACDICALPSRYEPFGTVIVEAWAMRRPLAAAAAAGARQYVEHERNGLISPIDDAPALADNLRRLVADAALREHVVEQGHGDFQRHFTREGVTDRLLAYYRRAIALGPRPRDHFSDAPLGATLVARLAEAAAQPGLAPERCEAAAKVFLAYRMLGRDEAGRLAALAELAGAARFLSPGDRALLVEPDDLALLTALPFWPQIEADGAAAVQRMIAAA